MAASDDTLPLQGIVGEILEAAMLRISMRPSRAQVAQEAAEWHAAKGQALMAIARHMTDG